MRFAALLLLAASTAFAEPVTLNGAGATFPYPLYSKWSSDYQKVEPDVRINYQSIGSGGGIRQITQRTVDFGASDGPMNDEQLAKAPGILHLPTVMGAVVVTYNLAGVDKPLTLSGPVVADLFLGKITRWNAPEIAKLNPGVSLPAQDVLVVHRSDGSGTTYQFVDYLAKISPEWEKKVGRSTSVAWPVGLGGKGNEGVAGTLKQTPGALGYVELVYAAQSKLPAARLVNASGRTVDASVESVTAAAAGVKLPDDLRTSITNSPNAAAYPIAGFTYLLAYKDQPDAAKGTALTKFIWWAVHDGQKTAPGLTYAPLPDDVRAKVEAKLKSITSGGKAIL